VIIRQNACLNLETA